MPEFAKHILIAFILLFSGFADAQDRGWASGNRILTCEAGFTNFRPFQLNNYLIERGAKEPLRLMQTFGIGYTNTFALARGGKVDGSFALHFFRNQYIEGYSAHYYQSGWELMTSIYGFDALPKARWIDFVIAPGVYWGSIKMRKYFPGVNNKQFEMFKNPFVAPMIRGDLRFQLGPVSIGGRWSYRFDISKDRWKKGASESLPGYKAREMQYIVYLGWVINWKNGKT